MTTNKEFNVLLILILSGSVIHARSKFDSYTPWSLFGTTEKDDIQKTYPTIPELQKKLFQPKENWFEDYLESKLNDIWEKKELQQLKPSTNSKNFGNFLAYKDNNIVPPWVRI